MKIFHNSQDTKYRNPFGAVRCDEKVALSVSLSFDAKKVILRTWHNESEALYEMTLCKNNNEFLYTKEIEMPSSPSLFWYYFIIYTHDNKVFYLSNNSKLGGEGEVTEYKTDNSFQITVYDKDFSVPEWFCHSIMYQIFPDRFYGGITENTPKRRSEYGFHKDWYEQLYNIPHPKENGPANCDFYGGNFKGIIEKIPYLKELGIGVIYLNPIFEAYSNHRYDTGNYKNTDPILGTNEDFKELCEKAHKNGIRIILDGVFSHTGSDSIYFDKYSYYNTPDGAYSNPSSPYRSWFQWKDDKNYESWWGCLNLSNVNELNPSYIDYILKGEDAVIKKWLRLGADGWRLDVADELPDEFIKILRQEAKSEKKDAVIIGEVWEDASNKESYSKKREYLYGYELDSVMNYPFKDLFISYLLGSLSGKDLKKGVLSIMENYPLPSLYSLMNIVSTHDTMRIKTVLGEAEDNRNLSFDERQNFKLSAEKETLAIKRVKLIIFMQMTFIGVPSIYYGDEIGMQGLSDPFNRMPYTWRNIDPELLDYCKMLTKFRNDNIALRTGELEFLYTSDDIIVYKREIKNSKDVFGKRAKNNCFICIINRSDKEHSLELSFLEDGTYRSCLNKDFYVLKETKNISIKPYSANVYLKEE